MKLTKKVCAGEFSCGTATVAARVFYSVLGPQAASESPNESCNTTASELKAFPAPDEQSEPEHLRAVTIEADQSIGEEVNHIVLFSK